jgi:1,2-diacylglycerol 3-alpha-glucosyltransferase
MNILMVSDVYFPRVNGVSTSIQTFARELAALGHRVSLIAPDYGQGPADVPSEFETLYRVPSRYLFVDPEDRMMRRGALFAHERELRDKDFDLVHIQTPFVAHYAGIALADRLGVPRVATYHTFFEECLYYYVHFMPRKLMRWAARRFSVAQCNDLDAIVVPSRAMSETLESYGVRKPMHVIPTGIDHARFRAGDGIRFRHRYGIDEDRPVIVHVGRIAHEKNIDFLLEVMAALHPQSPETVMIIAGEGPALKHLKARAVSMGLAEAILFVGYLDRRSDLLDCYRAGDVFVFSSRTETQGLVLLEAMSLGVPVVSTAVMGTRDVLVDGRGALIASEQVQDFAAKVLRVLSDSALKRDLRERAVEFAREWSAPAQALKLLDLYGAIAKGRDSAGLQAAVAGAGESGTR